MMIGRAKNGKRRLSSAHGCLYTLPSGKRDWQGMVIVEESPDRRRAAGLVPVEGDRWAITVSGYHKEPVPDDHQGVLAFLRSLPQPQLYNLMTDPHEKNNLAATKPELVKELADLIHGWYPLKSRKVNALPIRK